MSYRPANYDQVLRLLDVEMKPDRIPARVEIDPKGLTIWWQNIVKGRPQTNNKGQEIFDIERRMYA